MSLRTRVTRDTSAFGPGLPVDIGTQQIVGITVDNYSGFWLSVGTDGLFVPPSSFGWSSNLFGSSGSSVVVKKAVPGGIIQALSGDGAVVVSAYDTPVLPNPGVTISQGQRVQQAYQPGGFSNPSIDYDSTLAVGSSIPVMAVYPEWYGEGVNAAGSGDWEQVQNRSTVFMFARQMALVANVQQNVTPPLTAALLRFMGLVLSTDATCTFSLGTDNKGITSLYFGKLVAGTTPVSIWIPNGYFPGVWTQLQARSDVNANVWIDTWFGVR